MKSKRKKKTRIQYLKANIATLKSRNKVARKAVYLARKETEAAWGACRDRDRCIDRLKARLVEQTERVEERIETIEATVDETADGVERLVSELEKKINPHHEAGNERTRDD